MALIENIIKIVVGLILLVAFLPVINMLTDTAVGLNMASFSYSSLLILIIGLSGLFAVLMYVMSLFGEPNQPNQPVNPFG